MGLVHCDVKPGNVILNNHGAVKVLDFGVSKTVFEEQKKGVLRGTWGYMAPEQINQGQVVPRTDLYALAIVLYEMAPPSRCSLVKRRRIQRRFVS